MTFDIIVKYKWNKHEMKLFFLKYDYKTNIDNLQQFA